MTAIPPKRGVAGSRPAFGEPLVDTEMRYIVVCGGVCSSLGKGVFSSSVGALMRARGYRVTHIKIDPYLNPDAGLMSPFEHGEVFVLDDGGEVDLDLGNYERFSSVSLTHDHNITTGKIYRRILEKERAGEYLGKTVQVCPHVTQMVTDTITTVARRPVDGSGLCPQICIIELGGTVGDIESTVFLESLRLLRWNLRKHGVEHNFMLALCSLVPFMSGQKTKPTQHAVRALRATGLPVDLIVCRSPQPLEPSTTGKISDQCSVEPSRIISVHNVENLFAVPALLHSQYVHTMIEDIVKLPAPSAVPTTSLAGPLVGADTSGLGADPTKPSLPGSFAGALAQSGAITSPAGVAAEPAELLQALSSTCSVAHVPGRVRAALRPLTLRDFDSLSQRPTWKPMSVMADFDAPLLANPDQLVRPIADVHVGIVGKYFGVGEDTSDAYLSVSKSLLHASLALGCRVHTRWVPADGLEREVGTDANGWTIVEPLHPDQVAAQLDGLHAILVPGGFGARGVDGKVAAIRYARERRLPYFGVCLGMQLAVVEYARNVLGWAKAQTSEHHDDPRDAPQETEGPDATTPRYMTVIMPEAHQRTLGASMRLGQRNTSLEESVKVPAGGAEALAAKLPPAPVGWGCAAAAEEGEAAAAAAPVDEAGATIHSTLARAMYGGHKVISERHRHRFEINPKHIAALEAAGMMFSGHADGGRRRIICELPRTQHPFFFAVQFHPEFKSRPRVASPPFHAFVAAACDRARFEHRVKHGLPPVAGAAPAWRPAPPTSGSASFGGASAAPARVSSGLTGPSGAPPAGPCAFPTPVLDHALARMLVDEDIHAHYAPADESDVLGMRDAAA